MGFFRKKGQDQKKVRVDKNVGVGGDAIGHIDRGGGASIAVQSVWGCRPAVCVRVKKNQGGLGGGEKTTLSAG